ncbi:export ABC transporter ATP-binding protein [Spongiactinospora gelatinilytica]|uniref:Export ABC transporter ATP-binding protein n=1 Tax=Spongiactinospora gelatinilytica TaxID=2666298 RepID=A0A2W2G0E7_9ACTN|nr:ATP-binding cassette domain-containing protein [Spongiactinospora gelatinilytica]PZG41422.1 export ABC transporter ATP-binding protein [Spongiactinospora gelatinilytica]
MPISPPPGALAAGIRAQGLTKRYGTTTVVDDLSFTAAPGVITGFLGPNGAGKSTTMRMLLGLTRPTKGAITIGGRHISELADPSRAVGALLDARAVHPHRTAFDHLLAIAQTAGLGRERVGAVLDLVGLTGSANRRAGEFSLGMNQRLGIATALLGDPGVLVLDEPLNGLDPEGIRWMRTLMRDLAGEGRTILFSSHLMSEMELTADDLIVIGRGRLIAESSLEDFVRAHTSHAVTVRSMELIELADALSRHGVAFERAPGPSLLVTGTDPATIGKIAAAQGIALEELARVRESLEDVFLRLTHDVTDHEGHAA